MNGFRSVVVALGLSAFALVGVEGYAAPAGVTPAQFLANPSGFTQGKDVAQLKAAAAALLQGATDAEKQQIVAALLALVPNLPPQSQGAIGQAIGQVASGLAATNPSLAQMIQQAVAASGNQGLVSSFSAAMGQRQTTSVGGGGGGGGGGLGALLGNGVSALGGATIQTITQNNNSASP